jgi:hypothetical protein
VSKLAQPPFVHAVERSSVHFRRSPHLGFKKKLAVIGKNRYFCIITNAKLADKWITSQ